MIQVNNLTMVYKSGKGVFDVSFSIKKGEVFGYLGPNGAGKTTTIRNLLGFIKNSTGDCKINGLDCKTQSSQIHSSLGYIAGEIAFFDDMNGSQFLKFLSDMRSKSDPERLKKLLDRFDFDPQQNIRRMSKGMKQKLAIVAAFMHDPDVYILDEPSSGLDPLMQAEFIDLIAEEKSRGKTIMLSSHIFEEIEACCDTAAIIKDGRLIAHKDIASLKAEQRKSYTITVSDPEKAAKILSTAKFEIEKIYQNRITVAIAQDYNAFFKALSGIDVLGLDVPGRNLEQIFMNYYKNSKTEDSAK